jgi:hypothetical protein
MADAKAFLERQHNKQVVLLLGERSCLHPLLYSATSKLYCCCL